MVLRNAKLRTVLPAGDASTTGPMGALLPMSRRQPGERRHHDLAVEAAHGNVIANAPCYTMTSGSMVGAIVVATGTGGPSPGDVQRSGKPISSKKSQCSFM